jgi:hypothetical protein
MVLGGLNTRVPKNISSGAQYVICTAKMDEENPTNVGLTQGKWF